MVWSSESNYSIKDLSGTAKVELLYSNIYETSLVSEVTDYTLLPLDPTGAKYKVSIENGTSILEAGNPDLPKLSTSIIIPDQGDMELHIINSSYTHFERL